MTDLFLYNSLTKKNEIFEPKDKKNVKIYICGPTVYDSPHIGHARTYISFDVIRRVLEGYFKYNLTYVMNITDIDDKIINRANEKNVKSTDLAKKYEDEFFDQMKKINVKRPDFITRVTEYIKEIIEFIEKLEDENLAYVLNGSVYFDLENTKKILSTICLGPLQNLMM